MVIITLLPPRPPHSSRGAGVGKQGRCFGGDGAGGMAGGGGWGQTGLGPREPGLRGSVGEAESAPEGPWVLAETELPHLGSSE